MEIQYLRTVTRLLLHLSLHDVHRIQEWDRQSLAVSLNPIILHLLRRRKIDDGRMRMFSDFPYRSALHRQSLDMIVEFAMGVIKFTGFFQELQVSIHSILNIRIEHLEFLHDFLSRVNLCILAKG